MDKVFNMGSIQFFPVEIPATIVKSYKVTGILRSLKTGACSSGHRNAISSTFNLGGKIKACGFSEV